MENKLTILIKTFERKKSLSLLLNSIRKLKINTEIIICDDSKIPYKKLILSLFPDLNIQYYELPFDSGLAAGRNYLLKKIKTEYFLICDDDFYFDQRTDLLAGLAIIKQKKLDILGGLLYNYKIIRYPIDILLRRLQIIFNAGIPYNYIGNIKLEANILEMDYYTKKKPFYSETDIVLNFFIACTDKIRDINPWDESLKLSEHSEFFLRAKINKLKIAFTTAFATRHYPTKIAAYWTYRNRGNQYLLNIFQKYNLEKWIIKKDNGEIQVLSMNNNKLQIDYQFSKSLEGTLRRIYKKFLKNISKS